MREPLKPRAPALDQAMTFPVASVMVIWVLLKVEAMWTMPVAMFFLTRFFPFLGVTGEAVMGSIPPRFGIAGVDLPREKRIEVSLQYIYGIGKTTAKLVLERANVNPVTRTKDLTDDEVRRIRETIEQALKVEGDLRREISMNITRLMDLGCYRGLRHRKGLPVRGQRTHTNARTRKGPKKGLVRKPAAAAPAPKA